MQIYNNKSYCQKTKVVQDFIFIPETEIVKSISENWEISLGSKIQLEHNSTQIGEFDLEAGTSYKLFKYISLGLNYRYSESRNKDDEFISKNRIRAEIDANTRIRRFKADYRISFQNIDDDYFQTSDTSISRNILRNRIQLKYNIRKSPISAYTYLEHFGQLSDNNKYGIKVKFALGLNYSINRNHNIKIYYRIDKELNNSIPYVYYYLGFCYEYNF
jgi:hypothetical protein